MNPAAQDIARAATLELLQYGAIGVFVVVFAVVIAALWRQNIQIQERYINEIKAIHEQRVDDVRAVHAEVVAQNRHVAEALITAVDAIERNTTTLNEVRTAISFVGEEIRTHRRSP